MSDREDAGEGESEGESEGERESERERERESKRVIVSERSRPLRPRRRKPQLLVHAFHMETLINYKLDSMKFTTQNDLY